MTLYELVFSPINTPLTILLIALTVYRVVTMLFGLDFDFDLDFDVDIDIEVDNDMSIDSTGIGLEDVSNIELKNETIVKNKSKSLKWWQVVLIYFNFAELPFMFTLTSWIFFWWFITVLGTYMTLSHHNAFGFIVFVVAIIPSLILNKIFTTPFKSIFKKLERKGVASLDLLGRQGILDSNLSGDKLGRVKIKIESDPIIIYAKSLNGETLKAANIDIVGGETMFFDQIIGQITRSKGIDRLVHHSENITEVKDAILGSNDVKGNLLEKVKDFANNYGIGSEDIKNLTVASLLLKLQGKASSTDESNLFSNLSNLSKALGLDGQKLS